MLVPLPQTQRISKVSGFEYVKSQQKVCLAVSMSIERTVDGEVLGRSSGGEDNDDDENAVSVIGEHAS